MKYVTCLIFTLAFAINAARGQDGSGAAVCSRPSDFPPPQANCDCRQPRVTVEPTSAGNLVAVYWRDKERQPSGCDVVRC